MTQAGKPVYLSALLGGAARDLIAVLEHHSDSGEALTRIATTRPDVWTAYPTQCGGDPDAQIDPQAIRHYFSSSLTLQAIQARNRLGNVEHGCLLHATGYQQVLTLSLRGLIALWSEKA